MLVSCWAGVAPFHENTSNVQGKKTQHANKQYKLLESFIQAMKIYNNQDNFLESFITTMASYEMLDICFHAKPCVFMTNFRII